MENPGIRILPSGIGIAGAGVIYNSGFVHISNTLGLKNKGYCVFSVRCMASAVLLLYLMYCVLSVKSVLKPIDDQTLLIAEGAGLH